jgi:hypothetical protein
MAGTEKANEEEERPKFGDVIRAETERAVDTVARDVLYQIQRAIKIEAEGCRRECVVFLQYEPTQTEPLVLRRDLVARGYYHLRHRQKLLPEILKRLVNVLSEEKLDAKLKGHNGRNYVRCRW